MLITSLHLLQTIRIFHSNNYQQTPSSTTMSAHNRTAGRNIHIFDADDPATVLGGLVLTDGVTNANFYSMVDIVCNIDSVYFLQDESGLSIPRDGQQLHPGKYYIVTSGRFPPRLHDQAVVECEF
jgi:hypothetical protein